MPNNNLIAFSGCSCFTSQFVIHTTAKLIFFTVVLCCPFSESFSDYALLLKWSNYSTFQLPFNSVNIAEYLLNARHWAWSFCDGGPNLSPHVLCPSWFLKLKYYFLHIPSISARPESLPIVLRPFLSITSIMKSHLILFSF